MSQLPGEIFKIIIEYVGLYQNVAQVSHSMLELFREYVINNGPYKYTSNMPSYVKKYLSIPYKSYIINLPDDMYYNILLGSRISEKIQEFKSSNKKKCLLRTTINDEKYDNTSNIILYDICDTYDLMNVNVNGITIANCAKKIINIGNINELNIHIMADNPLFLPLTLKKLTIEYCTHIFHDHNDLNLPSEIENVVLINYISNMVMDLSKYTKLTILMINKSSMNISAFPPNLKTLSLTGSKIPIVGEVIDMDQPPLPTITFFSVKLPQTLESLTTDISGINYPEKLRSLTLFNIATQEKIPESVQELLLYNCCITIYPSKLKQLYLYNLIALSVTLPPELQVLQIENCNSLEIINAPKTLKIIEIIECNIIFDMSELNLEHLTVKNTILFNDVWKNINFSLLNVNKITLELSTINKIPERVTELTLVILSMNEFDLLKLPMSVYKFGVMRVCDITPIFIHKIIKLIESRDTIKILMLPYDLIQLSKTNEYTQMIEIIKKKNIVMYHYFPC